MPPRPAGTAWVGMTIQPTTPGGPIHLTWEFWSLTAPDASVEATFTFQGQPLAPPVVVQSLKQQRGTRQQAFDLDGQSVFPLDPKSRKALYTAGEQEIDLEVRVQQNGTLLGADTDSLFVIDEINMDWWQWGAHLAVDWNALFVLRGHYHNATLAEQTWGPLKVTGFALIKNVWVSVAGMGSPKVAAATVAASNDSPDVSWTTGVKWPWLNTNDWSIAGPLGMWWSWIVAQDAVDEFGNVASQPDSARFTLWASVSSYKYNQALIAHNEFILAASVSWLNVVAAAIILAVAGAYGTNALDPPAPDPAYRKLVTPRRSKLRPLPPDDPTLTAIGHFHQLAADVAADQTALSTTEGRALGARQAGDKAALDAQVHRYQEILQHMRETANQIPDAVAAIVDAGKQDPRLDPRRQARALAAWRRGRGIPAEIRTAWRKARLSEPALKRIDKSVRAGAGTEPLVESLPRIGTLVALSADQAARYAETVLGGGPSEAAPIGLRPSLRFDLQGRREER